MIKSNDILHYYFGSPFRFTFKDGEVIEGKLESFNDTWFLCGTNTLKQKTETTDDFFEINNFKTDGRMELILKHVSDLTFFQRDKYRALCKTITSLEDGRVVIADTPLSLHYLFTHGIDAFDLLETQQALHKKTMRKYIVLQEESEPEIETGIIELNAFRNKIIEPLEFTHLPDEIEDKKYRQTPSK